jgi:hypothetical protein
MSHFKKGSLGFWQCPRYLRYLRIERIERIWNERIERIGSRGLRLGAIRGQRSNPRKMTTGTRLRFSETRILIAAYNG